MQILIPSFLNLIKQSYVQSHLLFEETANLTDAHFFTEGESKLQHRFVKFIKNVNKLL